MVPPSRTWFESIRNLYRKLRDPSSSSFLFYFMIALLLTLVGLYFIYWIVFVSTTSIEQFEKIKNAHQIILKEREESTVLWMKCECELKNSLKVCFGCEQRSKEEIQFSSDDHSLDQIHFHVMNFDTYCSISPDSVCSGLVRTFLKLILFSQRHFLIWMIYICGIVSTILFIFIFPMHYWKLLMDSLNKQVIEEQQNNLYISRINGDFSDPDTNYTNSQQFDNNVEKFIKNNQIPIEFPLYNRRNVKGNYQD